MVRIWRTLTLVFKYTKQTNPVARGYLFSKYTVSWSQTVRWVRTVTICIANSETAGLRLSWIPCPLPAPFFPTSLPCLERTAWPRWPFLSRWTSSLGPLPRSIAYNLLSCHVNFGPASKMVRGDHFCMQIWSPGTVYVANFGLPRTILVLHAYALFCWR